MVTFVARLFLFIIPGWIVYATICEFNKLFSVSLNPYVGVMPVALIFLLQEYSIRKTSDQDLSDSMGKTAAFKHHRIFVIITWSLVICLFLMVILIWLGVIYKQITQEMNVYDLNPK